MWVKIEGIPTPQNNPNVAFRALERVGRVIRFDETSRKEGPKEFLRAKVIIPTRRPLIPGFYYEYSQDNFKWVHLRYEGVFNFCQNCGKIGHRKPNCQVQEELAKMEVRHRLKGICGLNFELMEVTDAPPLYSKK